MKTASKIIFLFFIALLSCNKKRDIDSKKTNVKSQMNTIINKYNPDSIFYNIDVEWNENGVQEELFLVTKNITVADSLFGGANNNENWERANEFRDEKHSEIEFPEFTYNIYMYENGKYIEFASLVYDIRDITYPSLRQGEFSNLNSSALLGKYKKVAISNFLRIIEISNDNLDTKSINLIYKNKKWIVTSKEVLKHNYELEYCIDTTYNDFSLKKMNIHYIFDYPQSNFTCR